MSKKILLESKAFNERFIIDEGWFENSLLVAGFIPVVGEIADTILIVKYLKEGRYIEAFLCVIALIPTVGDIIAKPLIFGLKGLRALTSSGKMAGALAKNSKLKNLFLKVIKYVDDPKVTQYITQIGKKFPGMDKLLLKGRKSIVDLGKFLTGKGAAKMMTKPGTAIKRNFQAKALRNLRSVRPIPPGGFSRWWATTYKAGRMRKNFIHKLLVGNKILEALGIFTPNDLEAKMNNPETQKQLLQNPQFQAFQSQVENFKEPATEQSGGNAVISDIAKGGISTDALKMLARFAV